MLYSYLVPGPLNDQRPIDYHALTLQPDEEI